MALRRWAVTALPVLVALVAAGCGQGDDEARVTLTEDGCTYEGKETPAKDDFGRFDLAVENRTLRFADFALARLARDVAFDEVEAIVASARRHLQHGVPPPPLFTASFLADRFSHREVDPRSSGVLTVDQPAGRYVVMCTILRASALLSTSTDARLPKSIYTAGRLVLKTPSDP